MPLESLLWVLAGVLTAAIACFLYYSLTLGQFWDSTHVHIESKPTRAAFEATRLTKSTFLLREYNDIYGENPHIYVKLIPSEGTILVIDTGCGGATIDQDIEITSLRTYIEEIKLKCNSGEPLNPASRRMDYIIIPTHCHYDHILGIEDFNGSRILASSHSPSFISPGNLPVHSLCEHLGIPTPSYTPTLVPHQHDIRSKFGVPFGVSILHTPGHTPDEVAIFDAVDKMLYVGDSLYEEDCDYLPQRRLDRCMALLDQIPDGVGEKSKPDGGGSNQLWTPNIPSPSSRSVGSNE
ncbi:beta-lactamase-like protein [Mycena rebaudengoi]|nr:beta-lactamase-like protein [Mycena rebaudengoi]